MCAECICGDGKFEKIGVLARKSKVAHLYRRTAEKRKSDALMVGVLDDPLIVTWLDSMGFAAEPTFAGTWNAERRWC